jgi:membrane protease YdiL (CAAX protease family)
MAVLVEGGLVLVALVLAGLLGVRLAEQMPSDGRTLGIALARGGVVAVIMVVVFYAVYHLPFAEFRRLREQVESLVEQLFHQAHVPQLALVAILAGIGEELLFRGVIQTLLIGWTSTATGAILAGLLFGLAHALSRLYFVLATLVGLLLGWITLEYSDLVAPMTAHALYDFVALAYLTRRQVLRRPREENSPPSGRDRA